MKVLKPKVFSQQAQLGKFDDELKQPLGRPFREALRHMLDDSTDYYAIDTLRDAATALCTRKGWQCLKVYDSASEQMVKTDDTMEFLQKTSYKNVLDLIELYIYELGGTEKSDTARRLADQLNMYFKIHRIPLVFRQDTFLINYGDLWDSTKTDRVMDLLEERGWERARKEFIGATEHLAAGRYAKWDSTKTDRLMDLLEERGWERVRKEFIRATEHLAAGRYADAIVNANKAFESAMNAVLKQMGEKPPSQTDRLIEKVCEKIGCPSYHKPYWEAIRKLLQYLPTIRNNHAHGGDEETEEASQPVADLAMNLSYSMILFLLKYPA